MTISCYDKSMIQGTHQDKSLIRRGIFKKNDVASEKQISSKSKRKSFSLHLKKPPLPFLSFPGKVFKSKKGAVGFAFACVLLVGGGAGYWWYEYSLSQNPAVIYQKKLQTITQHVSQSVQLPSNETPVIATVTDKTKLPKGEFFSLAQNGDKLVMYKKNKKVILYRPSTGQVITTATLDFQNITKKPHSVQTAVAGASTSVQSSVNNPSVSPSGGSPNSSASANSSYHPDGKILIAPQQ